MAGRSQVVRSFISMNVPSTSGAFSLSYTMLVATLAVIQQMKLKATYSPIKEENTINPFKLVSQQNLDLGQVDLLNRFTIIETLHVSPMLSIYEALFVNGCGKWESSDILDADLGVFKDEIGITSICGC